LRHSLLIAMVASLGIAACSGGGPQAIPGNSQVASTGGSALRLIVPGFHPDSSCAAEYLTCVTVARGVKTKLELCISKDSNCSSGVEGTYKWFGEIVTLKGKKYTGITATFKPNPGNPAYDIFEGKTALKNSHGHTVYAQELEACAYPSGSCKYGEIGIKTK
jgi:hypothetical protein